MQSVAKRVLEMEESGSPSATQKLAFQIQVEREDSQLDENDLERIFSRPALTRRKVDLFEAPEFVKRLSSYQEAEVGDEVIFSGQYKAFPKPTVKWFKDEEEITETKRHCLDSSSEFEGIVRLIIQDVIKQDEGAYKCKVENQEGVASTTGYLSVSGKPSDRSHGLQTKKMAQDRVSTPPYLRPIAEQKSMEEREEKEYQCLPPSPLQEFMDKIRHCAKSMHGPIVYGNLEGLFDSDDDVIRDFEEDADVFDEDQSCSETSESPAEDCTGDEVLLREEDNTEDETPEKQSVQVIDLFISPTVDLKASRVVATQASNEDSAYDSDGQTCITEDTPASSSNIAEDSKNPEQRTSLMNRRTKLALQRSLAVEIPESEVLPSDRQHPILKLDVGKSSLLLHHQSKDETDDLLITTAESSDDTIHLVFQYIKSPWIQLFLGVILSATSVSLAADIPPTYVIAAVVLISIVSFHILERQEKSGQHHH